MFFNECEYIYIFIMHWLYLSSQIALTG